MCENTKKNTITGAIMLLVAALIWGTAFSAQAIAADVVGPFTFNATRSLLAAVVLFICAKVFDRAGISNYTPADDKLLWKNGVLLGVILFVAVNVQQFGIAYTTVGKAGFITSLYILFVPIFGIFLRHKVQPIIWPCVLLALVGLYFLSVTEGFSVGFGDLVILLCAVAFAAHILVIDRVATRLDGVRLSCIQFLTVGVLSLIPMFAFEKPTVPAILQAWIPIVYLGVFSSGCAYTLQIFAQQRLEPATASLMMSSESIFSVLGGWIILGEVLSGREIFGCLLVFLAVVLPQIPWKSRAAQPAKN